MNLTLIGTGYVGLVTGACFAEMGHAVTCVDIDGAKIENLKQGVLPIFEPGLQSLVVNNCKAGRLRFTTLLSEAAASSTVFFIAVGTPPDENGAADLQRVLEAARRIGQHLEAYSIIVTKSTVPVGTAAKVAGAIQQELDARGAAVPFDAVSNPEFLKEGTAVKDFMSPDRVIVGCESERARQIMQELYAPFMRTHERFLFMGVKEAEMTKYAANAMLATRISFMNEIANLCSRLGVDVESVRVGIGSDSRIGYAYLYPGCGYGGSCFPKDVKALIRMAEDNACDPIVFRAIDARNDLQKHILFEKITGRFGTDLTGLYFGVWGLSFKPETDDLREAASVVLIHQLIGAGAKVKAYDPVAMPEARGRFPGSWYDEGLLQFVDRQYDAAANVDALVLVTEWKIFRNPDTARLSDVMRQRIIFDGRNQYDPAKMRQQGFEYTGIGR